MNDDDNESVSHSSSIRPMNTYSGSSSFSNPFISVVNSAQVNSTRPIGKPIDIALRKERPAIQTPQRKSRPFHTPNCNKTSTLSPYVGLLRGSGGTSTPVPLFSSHNFQRSTPPQQSLSSPVQEQCTGAEAKSATPSQEMPVFPSNQSGEENAFEELKDAYRSMSEQNKKIEALQYQVITLKNGRNSVARENTQMGQELESMRAKMGETSAKLSSVQSQLERSDSAAKARVQELAKAENAVEVKEEENAQLVAKLQQVSNAVEEVKSAYSQEIAKSEGLSARVRDAHGRVQQLVEAYGVLEKRLQDFGDAYDAHRRKMDETVKNAEELRTLASSALQEAENRRHAQEALSDTRAVLAELRDQLLDSHQVNDLLRNKLFDTTANLAEAKGRVKDLEEEKRGVWEQSLQSVTQTAQIQEALGVSEKRTTELAMKLRNLEEERAAVLAHSAEIEAKLEQIKKQNMDFDAELRVLKPLQQVKLQLQAEIANLTRSLEQSMKQNAEYSDEILVLRPLQQETLKLQTEVADLGRRTEQETKHNEELTAELLALRPLQQEKMQLQTEGADLTRRLGEEVAARAKSQTRLLETKDALVTAEKEAFVLRTQIEDTVNSRNETASEMSKLRITYKELETNLSNAQEKLRTREKDLQVEHDARLSSLQAIINKQNQEAAASKANYEWSEKQREQLRASLTQEQADLASLSKELKESAVREMIAAAKVDMHEAKIVTLTREIEAKEDLLRQLNKKVGSVEARYEAQSSTLRLTKEELGEMHEKLANANTKNQEAQAVLRAEISVFHEQKAALSATIEKFDRMMKAQEVAASERTADLQAVVRGLQKEIQQLYDAKMEGEGAVKHEMANSRERENVLKTRLTELQSTIFQLEASKQDEADASLALEKRAVSELEARVQALTEEKEEMVERQRSFRQRYQAGTLSDIEKDFVFMLVQDAEDLHEQASVAKDNEIKRRDAMISVLQARIAELELSLAQAFHPGSVLPDLPDLSTILNLKISPVGMIPVEQMPVPPAVSTTPQPTDNVMAPIPVNLTHDLDGMIPAASQMPSELSTPPQSPAKVKSKAISFVQLSKDDSEAEKENDPLPAVSTSKRAGEPIPVTEPAKSKKRLRMTTVKKGNKEGNTAPEPTGRGKQRRRKAGTT